MKIGSQLESASVENLAADPAGAPNIPEGRIWLNTVALKLKMIRNSIVKEIIDEDTVQVMTNKELTTPKISTFANVGALPAAGNAGRLAFVLADLRTYVDTGAIWSIVGDSAEPVGAGKPFFGLAAPSGYILASGLTIGSAASGATERANADTQALFNLFWTDYTDATLPIFTSGGGASTRGGSAAADFAANKRMSIPDARGRTLVGKDDMGGSTAGRITVGGAGINGTQLGSAGGTQTHTLDTSQIPSHTHSGTTDSTNTDHSHLMLGRQRSGAAAPPNDNIIEQGVGGTLTSVQTTTGVSTAATHTHTFTSNATGGGGAHMNTQPSLIASYIIKL